MEMDGGKVSTFFVHLWPSGVPLFDAEGLTSAQYPRVSYYLAPPVIHMPGKPKLFLWGHGRHAQVSLLLAPSHPRSPSSSARFSRNISRARFDPSILYPFDPRIPNLKRPRHIRFACCRTLISRTGIDESGKKGIFPSNYVRPTTSDGIRPGHQNWLTRSMLLAFRSCLLDGRNSSTPVPYYLTWRMINCDILAPVAVFPETRA